VNDEAKLASCLENLSASVDSLLARDAKTIGYLENVTATVEVLLARYEGFKNIVDAINERIDSVDIRIGGIEENQKNLLAVMTSFEKSIKDQGMRLSKMEITYENGVSERLDSIYDFMKGQSEKLGETFTELEETSRRIAHIEERLNRLEEDKVPA